MDLSQLRPPKGAKRERKRVGRGNASGTGTYAGKGMKGANARSGPGPYPGFEGGQLPLVRRMARKGGFTNPNRVRYEEVKLSDLKKFDDAEIGPELLIAAGIVKRPQRPIKVLSNGTVTRALTVRAHAFTAAAREKIEAAGGRAVALGGDGAAETTPATEMVVAPAVTPADQPPEPVTAAEPPTGEGTGVVEAEQGSLE